MTTTVQSSDPQKATALQKEWQLSQELFARLRDALLNRLFDLRPEKAVRRRQYLLFLFIIVGFLVSLREYPLNMWALHLQNVFTALFTQSGTFIPNSPEDPFNNLFRFGYGALTDPHTVQYLPLLLASFFIALQSAAIYLADIFELEDVSVARKFVSEVALSGSDETIRITQGDVFEGHRTSPNYLIGGPGKVVVDIDSVALFEKPDGTPRIIGPTGKEPGGKATLDGFERFRQAFDLRDHYIELRNPDGKFSDIKSRSLDGIRVSATDVKFVFSVQREKTKADTVSPYTFNSRAIEKFVYKATSKVTLEQKKPSTLDALWTNSMIGLVRGRLGGFMSDHKLTEYLASIGIPEFEKVLQQEKKIAEEKHKLDPSGTGEPLQGKEINPLPKFVPRHKIKDLFSELEVNFKKAISERGLELHWIGIGTWNMPSDITKVTEKHFEAWKLSRENFIKGSDGAFRFLTEEAFIQEMTKLIQDIPIDAYQTATGAFPEHEYIIKFILNKYRQQLIEAAEFIRAKEESVPQNIISAIEYLSEILGYKNWHWVGKVYSNDRQTEDTLYSTLVRKVDGDISKADRLIEDERKKFPQESRAQLILRAIERLDRDRQ